MGMFMILGGGGGKFNIVVVRFSSGISDRNILNSWNRSYDDSEYLWVWISSIIGSIKMYICVEIVLLEKVSS